MSGSPALEYRLYSSSSAARFSSIGGAALLVALVVVMFLVFTRDFYHTVIILAFGCVFLGVIYSLNAYFCRAWLFALELIEGDRLRCTSLAGTADFALRDVNGVELKSTSADDPENYYGLIVGSSWKFRTYFFDLKKAQDFVDFAIELKRRNPDTNLVY